MKNLDAYKVGEEIEYNIRIGNNREWRKAKVVESKIVYPEYGAKHKPYTMLFVEVVRTHFNAKTEKYYDRLNTEGVLYSDEVRNF